MFDVELLASLSKVTLHPHEKDGHVTRLIRVTVAREFDEEIAAGLGKDAKRCLALLRSSSMESCKININAVHVVGKFTAGEGKKADVVGVDRMLGRMATGHAPEDSGDVATIELELECWYSDEVWAWFGRNCLGRIRLTFTRVQLELAAAE